MLLHQQRVHIDEYLWTSPEQTDFLPEPNERSITNPATPINGLRPDNFATVGSAD